MTGLTPAGSGALTRSLARAILLPMRGQAPVTPLALSPVAPTPPPLSEIYRLALLDLDSRTVHLLYLRQIEDYTFEMCADNLFVTRERVRQLEYNALKKIATSLRSYAPSAHDKEMFKVELAQEFSRRAYAPMPPAISSAALAFDKRRQATPKWIKALASWIDRKFL